MRGPHRLPSKHWWGPGWAAVACMGVLVLVALPTEGLSAAPTVQTAPFPGYTTSTNFPPTASGCASVTLTKAASFTPHTGTGHGEANATAGTCSNSTSTTVGSSNVFSSVLYQESLPANTSRLRTVAIQVTVAWSANLSASLGTRLLTCPVAPVATDKVSGFYQDGSSISFWPNLTGPIVYNNQTRFLYNHTYGADGSCTVSSFVTVGVYGDVSVNGLGVQPSSSFGKSQYSPVFLEVATTNITYWSCSNQTYWNAGTWLNSSRVCTFGNQTTQSISEVNGVVGSATRVNSHGTFTGTIWFNRTIAPAKHTVLQLHFTFQVSTTVSGWTAASAAASMNLASAGKGFQLQSISIS